MRDLNIEEKKIISGGISCENETPPGNTNDELNDGLESIDDIFDVIHDKTHHHTLRK